MSDRLTSGGPLGDDDRRPSAAPERPAQAGEQPGAPPGYTSPAPPGAGGPAWRPVGGPAPARPVLSGWWPRAGAQLIDGLIVFVGGGLLFVAITAPFSIGFFASDEVGIVSIIVGALIAVLCVTLVALLYAPALMARTNGKTLGRQVTGIRVIRTNGQPIDFGFALVREVLVKSLLVGIASTLTGGIAYLLDVLWPLWDEENRALHDFVVNTRTIVD